MYTFIVICFYSVILHHVTSSPNVTLSRELRAVPQTPRGSCVLPAHPKNGKWIVSGEPNTLQPGDRTLPFTVLEVACDKSFIRTNTGLVICNEGSWSGSLGGCVEACPPLVNTASMTVSCMRNRLSVNCSEAVQGTVARYTCKPFYEADDTPVQVCLDGAWSGLNSKCEPICGRKPPTVQGANSTSSEGHPWRAIIYKQNEKVEDRFICVGALISPNAVLTGAHCLTSFVDSQVLPIQKFAVAVGKIHTNYSDDRDKDAQFSDVEAIYVTPEYQGAEQNFIGDIAVIITATSFVLSEKIHPVCIDWDGNYESQILTDESTGFVSGWSLKGGHEILKSRELSLPYVPFGSCRQSLPPDFKVYLTFDKICAGHLNRGIAVCAGDGGGALSFLNRKDNKYYAFGILSIAPSDSSSEDRCDHNSLALYTRISKYMTFISEKVRPNRISDVGEVRCLLPDHPANGFWKVVGKNQDYLPSDLVESSTILTVQCNKNYVSAGSNLVFCDSGSWSEDIRCKAASEESAVVGASCSPLRNTETTTVECQRNGYLANCSDPADGTVATFTCKPFYEYVDRFPSRICYNGQWDRAITTCVPICGVKTVQAETLVINGTNVTKGDYPWHVALYKIKENNNKEYLCGGSLISQKVILTAAHCVSDSRGNKVSKDAFQIAAGKYFQTYDDPQDTEAQYSRLQDIYIPSEYKGEDQNYQADIAILVTKTTLILSRRVQSVCVDWTGRFEQYAVTDPTIEGYVVGWGLTSEAGQTSNELKELLMPYIPYNQCKKALPSDFDIYLTHDKLCSGYQNRSRAVCSGDSGGGLASRNPNDGRYYITGIVSVSPRTDEGNCNSQQYSLFTRVGTHISFIYQNERLHQVNIGKGSRP